MKPTETFSEPKTDSTRGGPARWRAAHRGFTLVEVIVVLILLAVAAALVAPAIVLREGPEMSALASVVGGARDLAARRGETLYLEVSAHGDWRVFGAASLDAGAAASGRIAGEYAGPAFTLVIGPLGSCGFDLKSSAAARVIDIEPLSCEVRSP